MRCFVQRVMTDREVTTDLKQLIPDAAMRRRMSRVVKMAVSTAVECVGGVEHIDELDTILTATGWGCLADSERFLRNLISEQEQLLNPTPFIQSTFNTVGGQVALLRHNHCYNVTYVHRGHSFEDALLDALMRAADGQGAQMLVGAFDEMTPSQHRIMERMGLFRTRQDGEGAVFALLTACQTEHSVAEVAGIDFPSEGLDAAAVHTRYATDERTKVIWNDWSIAGCYPTASAQAFRKAVELIEQGTPEVIVYNAYQEASPAVIRLRWVG